MKRSLNYELKILDWGVGCAVGQIYGLGDIPHTPYTHIENFVCSFIRGGKLGLWRFIIHESQVKNPSELRSELLFKDARQRIYYYYPSLTCLVM